MEYRKAIKIPEKEQFEYKQLLILQAYASIIDDNNLDKSKYTLEYLSGLDGDDFVTDQYTVIVKAVLIPEILTK